MSLRSSSVSLWAWLKWCRLRFLFGLPCWFFTPDIFWISFHLFFTISVLPISKIQDFPYSNHTRIFSTQTTTKCIPLDLILIYLPNIKYRFIYILYTRNDRQYLVNKNTLATRVLKEFHIVFGSIHLEFMLVLP